MPPITAVLGGFGSAQWIYRDFPESVNNEHAVKDILGKNVRQFGFMLAELINGCLGTDEFGEVCVVTHFRQFYLHECYTFFWCVIKPPPPPHPNHNPFILRSKGSEFACTCEDFYT